MNIPELIIGAEDDGTPSAAACTLCGEWLGEGCFQAETSEATVVYFRKLFEIHVRRRHSSLGREFGKLNDFCGNAFSYFG